MSAPSRPARIVVESGTHLADNLGDLAMLQVAVERLREDLPGCRLAVPTAAPDLLARHCPGVEPLPAEGRWRWLPPAGPPELPPGPRALRTLAARARGRAGRLGLRAERAAYRSDPAITRLIDALLAADGFLLAGRGGTTDAFRDDAVQTLELVRAALATGRPTAALGQGIGPVADPVLLAGARAVLPRLAVLGVRDHESGRLAEGLGVPADRLAVTGDDALGLAAAAGPAASGDGLGFSLRAAAYAAAPELLSAAGAVVADAARELGARLVAVPISLASVDGDARTIRAAIGDAPLDGGEDVASVPDAVERAGRCRAVVTGTHHAAVFALARGVPVVGLHGSPFYAGKLGGLRESFAGGLEPVALGGADFPARLRRAIDAAWHAPASERERLAEAAGRQAAAGRAAYARFSALVASG